jgi:hypothetical protein
VYTGVTNLFGIPIGAPWNITTDFSLVSFDWTAPNTPGATIGFNWQPSAAIPAPEFNFNYAQGPWGPLPATYIGTTLTVIPTPPAAALGFFALGACGTRRRRH